MSNISSYIAILATINESFAPRQRKVVQIWPSSIQYGITTVAKLDAFKMRRLNVPFAVLYQLRVEQYSSLLRAISVLCRGHFLSSTASPLYPIDNR